MSYTNPQQIVDTQSAQHLANLQQTITGTFANVAANYSNQKKQEQIEIKKRLEDNAKIVKANQDQEDEILYNYEKYKIDNPELNLPDVLPSIIDEYSNIKNALDLGNVTDPKEQAKLRNKLLKIRTLPEQLKSNMTALSELMLTYKETYGKLGTQGGLDGTQTSPEFLKALNIFFNNTNGKRDVAINVDESGNLSADFIMQQTDKDGKHIGDATVIPYRYLRDYLADKENGPIITIPDLTKAQENIDNRLLVEDTNGKKIIPESFLTTPQKRKKGDFIEEVRIVDGEKIRSQFGKVLSGDIESMNKTDFIAYYNNILNPSDPITKSEAIDNETMQQKRQEGVDLYIDKYIQRYGKYEEVISKTRILRPEKPKDLSVTEKKDISNRKDAIMLANDLKRDPRLKFDYNSIRDLAGEYTLNVFRSGTEEEIDNNTFSEIIIKGSGGTQATILKSDTPDDIAKKIIRLKSPKLGESTLKEVFKELGKLKEGEGVYKQQTGLESYVDNFK